MIVIAPAVELSGVSDREAVTEAGNYFDDFLLTAVFQNRDFDFHGLAVARFEERSGGLPVLAGVSALTERVIAHSHDLAVSSQEQHVVETARNLLDGWKVHDMDRRVFDFDFASDLVSDGLRESRVQG